MPKPHPAASRHQTLAHLDEGHTVRDVAASLGIAESCLQRWNRQQCINLGLANGLSAADCSAPITANQQIRDLEEEVKILRRTAAAVEEEVLPQ